MGTYSFYWKYLVVPLKLAVIVCVFYFEAGLAEISYGYIIYIQVTIQLYPCAGPLNPVARVFVAMDGDKKRSWMTQRETIASLDIGFKGPVLNRYIFNTVGYGGLLKAGNG